MVGWVEYQDRIINQILHYLQNNVLYPFLLTSLLTAVGSYSHDWAVVLSKVLILLLAVLVELSAPWTAL